MSVLSRLLDDNSISFIQAELAELTGEQYTLNSRLQYIDNRIDVLREELARRHKQEKQE